MSILLYGTATLILQLLLCQLLVKSLLSFHAFIWHRRGSLPVHSMHAPRVYCYGQQLSVMTPAGGSVDPPPGATERSVACTSFHKTRLKNSAECWHCVIVSIALGEFRHRAAISQAAFSFSYLMHFPSPSYSELNWQSRCQRQSCGIVNSSFFLLFFSVSLVFTGFPLNYSHMHTDSAWAGSQSWRNTSTRLHDPRTRALRGTSALSSCTCSFQMVHFHVAPAP